MDIAITGVSCKFPGSDDQFDFWNKMLKNTSSISKVPSNRWDWKAYWGDPATEVNKTDCCWGGFINDVDAFDYDFFGLVPKVVEAMDPQQRLMLEQVWKCLEDAAIAPSELRGHRVGMFASMFNHDYKQMQESGQLNIEAHHATGSAASIIVNRVSHFFDFKGPSLAIDAACSGGLNAIHNAAQALELGDCDLAVAAGINLILTPTRHISFSKMGMMSPTGTCRTFDESANGYVRGEGIGVLLLKPLDKALADRDQIYGVLKGSAVNHCGETYTLTYPSPEAQAAVIKDAHERAGVAVDTVNYIEAHGTGTPKGDPIEFRGLTRAYEMLAEKQSKTLPNGFCSLGSVKTNIGHLEAAAGLAGVIKVLMALKNKQLPGLVHFQRLNSRITLEDTPFSVLDKNKAWPQVYSANGDVLPRRAGVSSFGFGGTNAHVILEDAPVDADEQEQKVSLRKLPFYPVCISAKSDKDLQQNKTALYNWLLENSESVSLEDLCFTLCYGRDHFQYRDAALVSTLDELKQFLVNGTQEHHAEAGEHIRTEEAVKILHKKRASQKDLKAALIKIVALYLQGKTVRWESVYRYSQVRKISAPGYVFNKHRFWLSDVAEHLAVDRGKQLSVLVHENVSDFDSQAFQSCFHGDEFFLAQHRIRGNKVFPAAACIEMVRSGLSKSWQGGDAELEQTILTAMTWRRPLSIDTKTEVKLSFYPLESKSNFPEIEFEITDNAGTVFCSGIVEVQAEHYHSEPMADFTDAVLLSKEQLYPVFAKCGLDYGPMFQGITELTLSESVASADLTLAEDRGNEFFSHPSLIDAAIQISVAQSLQAGLGTEMLLQGVLPENTQAPLPYKLERVDIISALHNQAHAVSTLIASDDGQFVFDIDVFSVDQDGKRALALRMSGLTLAGAVFKDGGRLGNVLATDNHGSDSQPLSKQQPALFDQALGYYTPQWIPAELRQAAADVADKNALFLCRSQTNRADVLLTKLAEHFNSITVLNFGSDLDSAAQPVIDPEQPDSVQTVVSYLNSHAIKPDYVIHYVDADAVTEASASDAARAMFLLVQSLMKVTRTLRIGTFIEAAMPFSLPEYSALSGFYKTMAIEKPSFSGSVVQASTVQAELIVEELNNPDQQTDICYDHGQRWIRRFTDLTSAQAQFGTDPFSSSQLSDAHGAVADAHAAVTFRDQGVYLITGGLGALGLIFARFLLEKYQAKIVLTGRSSLSNEKQQQLLELASVGGEVVYFNCDVSSAEDCQQLIGKIHQRFSLLNGVIHSAGVIEDSFIIRKTPEAFDRVLLPKLNGTLHLDNATANEPLDLFILFSSVTGVLGNIGQCDYSYGNSFEDYFSHYRNRNVQRKQRSGKTLAINWPYWQDGGMTLTEQEQAILFQNFGLQPLATAAGIKALEVFLTLPFSQVCVMPGDAAKVCQVLGCVTSESPTEADHRATATRSPVAVDKTEVLDYLSLLFADALKVPKSRFSQQGTFQEFGFDSVIMLDMTSVLEKRFKDIPKTLFYEHQTMSELADYLIENHSHSFAQETDSATQITSPEDQPLSNSSRQPVTAKRQRQLKFSQRQTPMPSQQKFMPVAIIGLAGRYPQADDLNEFWENLCSGKDCITEVPSERWDCHDNFAEKPVQPGKSYSKWGGFLRQVDQFDPLHFNISPYEAERLDPQERLFLEVVSHAVEDAGYCVDNFAVDSHGNDHSVGVYAASMWGEYQLHGFDSAKPSNSVSAQSFYWSIANRVSYHFNLSGPSITLDTACSSSLTAIHLACNALATGEIKVAIAGGVNLSIHPKKYSLLSDLHFLSTDGRCRSFGEGGDGYVPAEGVGAVILKPLAQAEEDGDHIYAVIRSTAINHGGETSGFTVPNPKRQAALIKEALTRGAINPRHLSYVEAHGTGTSLGDPIEINGLTRAFDTDDRQFCRIGSVKSNIGHAEATAGLAGVTKVILQMQHQQLVPSLHSATLNPYIEFDKTPFKVQQQLEPWAQPSVAGEKIPRLAGVSSFGAGGANGHVILEEYQMPVQSRKDTATQLIVLSARSEAALTQMAENLCDHLQNNASLALVDIAFTLQTGRKAFAWRLAVIANSVSQLTEQLVRFVGRTGQPGVDYYFANIKNNQGAASDVADFTDLSLVASAWVEGAQVDWRQWHKGAVKRVPLPGYAYQRSRYWVQEKPGQAVSGEALQSLLDSNCSEHDCVRFSKHYREDAFYLKDHQLHQSKVLPGVVCLEMALQAGQRALPDQRLHALYDIQWLKPLVVDEQPEETFISVQADEYGLAFAISQQPASVFCRGAFGFVSKETAQADQLTQQTDIGRLSKQQLDIEKLKLNRQWLNESDINQGFSDLGFSLGDSFKSFVGVGFDANSAVAELQLPVTVEGTFSDFSLHPSLMDSVLRTCLCIGGFNANAPGIPVPVSLSRLQWLHAVPEHIYAYAKQLSVDETLGRAAYDIYVTDLTGQVVVYLENCVTQNVPGFITAKNKQNAQPHSTVQDTGTPVTVSSSVAHSKPAVEQFVIEKIAQQTKINAADISPDDDLERFGINSIMALSIHAMIAEKFGDDVPKTLFFEYQSVAQIAEYLIESWPQAAAENFAVRAAKADQVAAQQQQEKRQAIVDTAQSPYHPNLIDSNNAAKYQAHVGYFHKLFRKLKISLDTWSLDHEQITQLLSLVYADLGADIRWLLFASQSVEELAALSVRHGLQLPLQGTAQTPAKDQLPVHPHRRHSHGNSLARTPLATANTNEDIAIIGLSGRYPMADNLDELWQNLLTGKDCISEVPRQRWNHDLHFNADRQHKGKVYSKWGGFMDGIDQFDAPFFGLTRREAELLDPQERLFLETAWQCFEDAAYPRSALSDKNVGVFVGAMWGHYELIQVSERQQKLGLPGSTFAAIANRVSYFFNLHGPSMAMDSMCSSSLTAIHTACQSIRSGDCDMAIAGGVNVSLHPTKYHQLSQMQFLSSDGRCRAFGDGGDGYVPGEGVGAVLLKPLSQALNDADNIYAVIKGSALNHGGKASGFTVPSPRQQARVIKAALAKTDWDLRSVNYIEAHGTGTSLGDPIELSGIKEAYGSPATTADCALGSIKSNIGHLESAAGIAGLTKILLQMRHKTIAPSLHSAQLNPNLAISNSRFYIPQTATTWQTVDSATELRAGLSSFGAGGANAHLLIEDYRSDSNRDGISSTEITGVDQLFLLSAEDNSRLRMYAQSIKNWLDAQVADGQADLARLFVNLCYSAMVGREQRGERIALVAHSLTDLAEKLNLWLSNQYHGQIYYGGERAKDQQLDSILDQKAKDTLIDMLLQSRDLIGIAKAWVSCLSIDWALVTTQLLSLPSGYRLQRISFPSQPLIRQRYWVEQEDYSTEQSSILHPLLDKNVSTITQQRFEKRLTGNEFFLRDHQVQNDGPKLILPGVAHLEMARIAAQLSLPDEYSVFSLRDILWLRPVDHQGSEENIAIELQPASDSIQFSIKNERNECSHGFVDLCHSADAPVEEWLDLQTLMSPEAIREEREEIYAVFEKMGFFYGPSYQCTQWRQREKNVALAKLTLPESLQQHADQFYLHPSLMDAAVRTCLGLGDGKYLGPMVPFSLEYLEIRYPVIDECYVYVSISEFSTAEVNKYNLVITDVDGKILIKMHHLSARYLHQQEVKKNAQSLCAYKPIWQDYRAGNHAMQSKRVMVLADCYEDVLAFDACVEIPPISVVCGNVFCKTDYLGYEINITESDCFNKLFDDLKFQQIQPEFIINLMGYHSCDTSKDSINSADELTDGSLGKPLQQALATSLHLNFKLFKAFDRFYKNEAVKVINLHDQSTSIETDCMRSITGFANSMTAINHRIQVATLAIDSLNNNVSSVLDLLSSSDNINGKEFRIHSGNQLQRKALAKSNLEAKKGKLLTAGATCLITGGTGKLGLSLADHLAKNCAPNIVLVSRNLPDDNQQMRIALLNQYYQSIHSESRVIHLQADISDPHSSENLMVTISEQFAQVDAVIHAAGVAGTRTIKQIEQSEFDDSLTAKIHGLVNLNNAVNRDTLQWFVNFSSISAYVGDLGSGSYGAANHFMDLYSQHYNYMISIDWPLWAEGGLTIPQQRQASLAYSGLSAMPENIGLDVFDSILINRIEHLIIAYGDRSRIDKTLAVSSDQPELQLFAQELNCGEEIAQ